MTINATFYQVRNDFNTYEKHVPAPYLRRTLTLQTGNRYALTVSGLGFYELYAGGEQITKGLLAPYISNPDDLVYFDRYDVTDRVGPDGKLAVGLILGNGMQNAPGGRVWDFDVARFRGPVRFACLLTTTRPDGSEETADIGGEFVWHESPILFDDLRSGCFYDARRAIEGWNTAGFDDADWQPVTRSEQPRGEYRLCEADPIRVREEIAPIEVRRGVMDDRFSNRNNMRLDTEFKFNQYGQPCVIYDFGINSAGVVRLRVNGRPGQQICIRFCELMTQAGMPSDVGTGSFYPEGYGQTALYICKGAQDEVFVPSFCYFGFRWAAVFGLEEDQIRPETLTFLRANSDLRERAGFTCSDETMNALGRMTRVSDLANFYYFPTDCPHREKNGWTGDAAVSAEHMTLTLTPDESYIEWLRGICKAQADNGALPGIVPTGGWGFEWGNGPAWDNVLTELCWQLFRLRGDLRGASESADSMLRYLAYIDRNRDADGLIGFGLGDWVQPDRGAGDPIAPARYTSSVISMYIAWKSAQLFDALGLPLRRDFARRLCGELREAIRAEYIDLHRMTAQPLCQSTQAMALYYGVFEPGEETKAFDVLLQTIHDRDDHLDVGMLGLRVIFHVLSDHGCGDLAYRMITRDDHPSYGAFVRRGWTSLPEDFKPDEDNDWPNSLNHHFFGDIVSWFIQRVAGIRVNPNGKGPDDFDIAPDFLEALDRAEAHYDAPCGRVAVKWERDGENVTLTVEAPDAATGRISLPNGWRVIAEQTDRPPHGATRLPLKAGVYRAGK